MLWLRIEIIRAKQALRIVLRIPAKTTYLILATQQAQNNCNHPKLTLRCYNHLHVILSHIGRSHLVSFLVFVGTIFLKFFYHALFSL